MKTFKGNKSYMAIGLGVTIVLVVIGAVLFVLWGKTVQTTSVEQREMPISYTGNANLTSLTKVTIKPTGSAPVATYAVTVGDTVKQGQVVATLDTKAVDAQIAMLQSKVETLRSEQSVAVASPPTNNSSTITANAGAGGRPKLMLENGIITMKEYNTIIARSGGSSGGETAGGGGGSNGNIDGSIDALESTIAQLQQTAAANTIIAPIDGRVTAIYNEQQKIAIKDRAFMVIQQWSPIVAAFAIPSDMAKLVAAQINGTTQNAYIKIGDTTIEGHVTYVAPVANEGGQVLVKATFDNKDKLITPGGFYDVTLHTDKKQMMMAIPTKAIHREENGGTFVYTLTADRTIDIKYVTVGAESDGYIAIVSGITDTDQIVTSAGPFVLGEKVLKA